MSKDIREEFKEGFKAVVLKERGTLDETDDFYSFEEGWRRFELALAACIKHPPMNDKDVKEFVQSNKNLRYGPPLNLEKDRNSDPVKKGRHEA